MNNIEMPETDALPACLDDNDTFLKYLKASGVHHWSQANCQWFLMKQAYYQCSLTKSIGLKAEAEHQDIANKVGNFRKITFNK